MCRLLLIVAIALICCCVLSTPSLADIATAYPIVKTAVTVDSAGVMYFSHASNSLVSAVVLSTGVQMSYLLNNTISRPSGLVSDGRGSLYIADSENNRVVRVNTTTGLVIANITTVDPALHWPCGVALDAANSLYIADTWNHRVVKLDSSGVQQAVYTAHSPSLRFPAGVAVDGEGSVYVADGGNDRVVKLSGRGGQVLAVYETSGVKLRSPSAVMVDAAGAVYVADTWGHRVVKLMGVDGSAAGGVHYQGAVPVLSERRGAGLCWRVVRGGQRQRPCGADGPHLEADYLWVDRA